MCLPSCRQKAKKIYYCTRKEFDRKVTVVVFVVVKYFHYCPVIIRSTHKLVFLLFSLHEKNKRQQICIYKRKKVKLKIHFENELKKMRN